MKKIIDAPWSGSVNFWAFASAESDNLYSLYRSNLSSLFSPGGRSLSLGILKNILSP